MNIFPTTFYLTIWTGGIDVQNSYASIVFFNFSASKKVLLCFTKKSKETKQKQGNHMQPWTCLQRIWPKRRNSKSDVPVYIHLDLEIYCRFIYPPAKKNAVEIKLQEVHSNQHLAEPPHNISLFVDFSVQFLGTFIWLHPKWWLQKRRKITR